MNRELLRALAQPHRLILILIAAAVVALCTVYLDWSWLPEYWNNGLILEGLWTTIWLLALSWAVGLFFAVWLGLAQAAGPWYLALPAKGYCSVIRGTPLLLQLWFIYYGLGSLFPYIPVDPPLLSLALPARSLALWPAGADPQLRRLRGRGDARRAAGVPTRRAGSGPRLRHGALTILRRIWLPQAVRRCCRRWAARRCCS